MTIEVRGSTSTTDYVALPSDFDAKTDTGTSHYAITGGHLYRDGSDIGTITGNATHNIAIAFNSYAGGSFAGVVAGLMDSAYYFDSSDNPGGNPYVVPYVVMTASAAGKASSLQTDLSLQPVNDAPVATAGSATSVEGAPTVIDFAALTSDVDTPDSGLTIEISGQPAHGTLTGSGLTRTYTPDAGYGGADALTYRVYDGNLYSEYRTVNLTATAPKHPPVAVDDRAEVATGKSISVDAAHGVLANDTDADGDALSVAAATTGIVSGDYGTLTLKADGSYTYASNGTQAPAGTHAHDRFSYTVDDGHGGSSTAVLDIGVDRAPIADARSFGLQAGTSVTNDSYGGFFPDGVLFGSSDDDGDALAVTSVSAGGLTRGVSAGTPATIAGTYGTLTLSGDGTFRYAQDATKLPTGIQNGRPTDTFGFTIGDGHGGSDATSVTFYINRSPTASNDTAEVTRDVGATVSADAAHGVLANDSDLDRDALMVAAVTGTGASTTAGSLVRGRYGDLTLNADGSYSYVVTGSAPATGASDVFTYTVSDQRSVPDGSAPSTATGTLSITVPVGPPAEGHLLASGRSIHLGTGSGGIAQDHSSTALSNGNVVVSWYEQGSSADRILAEILDAQGHPVGDAIVIETSDHSAEGFFQPRVAALSNGGFVVTYSYADPGTNGWETHNRIVGADGTLGRELVFASSADGANNGTGATVAGLADGGFLVVVDGTTTAGNGDTVGSGLLAARYTAAGDPNGSVPLLSIDPLDGQSPNLLPQVAGLAGGGYVATWFHGTGVASDELHLHGQAFDAANNPVGAVFDLGDLSFLDQRQVSVRGLTNGNFVVAWSDGAGDTAHIRSQLFAADGTRIGDTVQVDASAGNAHLSPVVAPLADGGFAIGWADYASTGLTGYDIHARVFDALGRAVSPDTPIAHGSGTEWHPSATVLSGDTVLFGWEGNSNDLTAQAFTFDTTHAGPALTQTWGGTGDWTEAGHWDSGHVPGVLDDVVTAGGLTISTGVQAASLHSVGGTNTVAGGSLSLSGSLTIDGYSDYAFQGFRFLDGGTVTAFGGVTITATATAMLFSQVGQVGQPAGVIHADLQNDGRIDLNPFSSLVIDGDLTGSGFILAEFGSTLEVKGAAGSQTISLYGDGVTLILDDAASAKNMIYVGGDDTLDLKDATAFGGSLHLSRPQDSLDLVGIVSANLDGTTLHATRADGRTLDITTYFSLNAFASTEAGPDFKLVTASDGHGGTVISFESSVEHAPVATDFTRTVQAGGSTTFNSAFRLNGYDEDYDTVTPVSIQAVGSSGAPVAIPADGSSLQVEGQYGTLTIDGAGTVSYLQDKAVTGASGHPVDHFLYTVSDGRGGTDTGSIDISVNRMAVVSDDTATIPTSTGMLTVDTAQGVLANDSDPDGDGLTVTSVTSLDGGITASSGQSLGGPHGTLTLNWDGSYSYEVTLRPTVYGDDSLSVVHDRFSYTVSDSWDGLLYTDDLTGAKTTTLDIAIAVNHAPQARDDTATLYGTGTSLVADAAHGLLANDTDRDGDRLSVTGLNGSDGNNFALGEYGTLSVGSDGSYVYTLTSAPSDPNAREHFTYTVSDQAYAGPFGFPVTSTASFDIVFSSGSPLVVVSGATDGPDTLRGNAHADVAELIDGGAGDDRLFGFGGDDHLIGGLGNDTLDGGTGADLMEGGLGNDSYRVDDVGDRVIEAVGGGSDTVYASVSYALAAGQEIETLRANAGTTGLTLTGNELANTLISGGGDDILIGGDGNDLYAVNGAGDQVVEAAGGGIDTVNASVSYALAAGQEIETLRANAGTTGLTLTGNGFANTLISGAGDDILIGGDGNDIYAVNSAGDQVVEAAGGGIDTVNASVSYTLGAGQEIEILRANAGTTGITLTGNELANKLYSGGGDDILIGGDGSDAYYVNGANDQVIEGVGGGTDTVYASVNYALGSGQEVEILRANAGTTGLTLTGNELANTLISGAGDDILIGGDDNDLYAVNSAGDRVIEAAGGGTDTVNASVSYALGAGQEIEILRANAGTTGLTLTGNELVNKLYSGGGDDTLIGGAGNDAYYVNSTGDQVIEASGGGIDTVYASVSYALAAGQEVETLRANAGATGLTLTGNAFANTLISGGGDDILVGGDGNDIYAVNSAGDQVIEAAGGGIDTVNASVSYALGAGQEIEILRANAGTTGLTLTGNELANKLYSGGGDDTLVGGDGSDAYYVNGANDQVIEAAGGGTDTVYASVNYALGSGQEVEILRANAGTTGLTLTGNELANTLISGGGDDILIGGGGNDTYAVNSAGDRVIEAAGGGTDTVNASVSYTLGAGQEIEILRANAGTTGLTLAGNAFANTIVGGAGDDVISGGGGADILRGNGGSDTFVFKALSDSVVGSARVTIADFTIGSDRIDLSGIQAVAGAATDQAFTFIGTGAFTKHAGELHQVTSGGSTLIEGDVDGNGTADFQIALTGLRTLHATDFVL